MAKYLEPKLHEDTVT